MIFMQALHSKKESLRAVKRFRERLKEIAFNFEELEWGFPNGERPVYPTYSVHTHLGDLQIGVPASWDTRIPHLIRFTKEQGPPSPEDRRSVVSGTSVSVRVDLGGRRIIKTKKKQTKNNNN